MSGEYVKPSIVPWPVVDGERVTTNGVMEDSQALGLDSVGMGFGGWCGEGFYTHEPEAFKARLEAIDWRRVRDVKAQFDIKMGSGGMVFTDVAVYWVTERRFQRLMRACFKGVSMERWEHEVKLAVKVAGKAGKSYSSGRL